MREKNSKIASKLTAGIAMVIVLSICLGVTTFALAYTTITVEHNLFSTATMQINLNNGVPVVEEDEIFFEPGMEIEKAFFLENQGSIDIYYKIYFEQLDGGLANFMTVIIKAGEDILYDGPARNLTRDKVEAADKTIAAGQRQDLSITFCFPSDIGNEAQGLEVSFQLAAEAVQARNNPFKRFD